MTLLARLWKYYLFKSLLRHSSAVILNYFWKTLKKQKNIYLLLVPDEWFWLLCVDMSCMVVSKPLGFLSLKFKLIWFNIFHILHQKLWITKPLLNDTSLCVKLLVSRLICDWYRIFNNNKVNGRQSKMTKHLTVYFLNWFNY